MTSELDKHFGPKPAVAMPPAKPSRFGRFQARIRATCDAFAEEMGWNLDPTTKRIIAAGAKGFVDVHGDKPRLVKRTIQHLKNTAPHIYENIKSPGSLITTARTLSRKPDPDSPEGRERYRTDFWGNGEDDE